MQNAPLNLMKNSYKPMKKSAPSENQKTQSLMSIADHAVVRSIIDNSSLLVIILDENGKIVRFNPACQFSTGYTEQEVIGKSPGDFLIDYHNVSENIFHDILQEQNVIHRSDYWKKKNNDQIYVSWTVSFVEEPEQNLNFIVMTGVNLTKQIYAEIQKESFFQLSMDMLCITDSQGKFIELNHAWEKNLGHKTEHLLENSIFEHMHPDDRMKAEEIFSMLLSDKNTSTNFINRFQTATGEYRWLMWNTIGVPDQKVIYAIARDITGIKESENELEKHRYNLELTVAERTMRLKESEERFRRMANDSPALIWMTDAEGLPVWFNKRWKEYTGKDVEGELDNTWMYHIHEDDRKIYLEKRLKAHELKIKFEMEFRLRKNDGNWAWIADIGIPRYSDFGNFEGFIGYSWDISERKIAENEMRRAKEDAEQANQAKSEFLSCMSHELRTPLNAVLGFAQMMDLTCKLDGQAKIFNQEIYKSGKHLLELIDDLLDLSKIEAGQTSIRIEDVGIYETIMDCIALISPIAEKKGIQISFEKKENIYKGVKADKIRLRQVLLNLISNAIKFNIESGNVTIFCQETSKKTLRIYIRDTGVGINDDIKSHLFVPFYHEKNEQNIVQGAGIGLVLAQKLVLLMHGNIGFDTEINKGSTFWVEFPIGNELHENELIDKDALKGETNMSDKKKVLYIEDNPTNLLLIEHVLARISQVEMLSAPNPGLGLDLASSKSPDLILLDINLPGMDGYEVLKRLRENSQTSNIPVIAISANAMSGDIDKGKNAGFVDYITKPIDIQNFLDLLSKTLRITIETFD